MRAACVVLSKKYRRPLFRSTVVEFPGRARSRSWAVFDDSGAVRVTRSIDSIILWSDEERERVSDQILRRTIKRYG